MIRKSMPLLAVVLLASLAGCSGLLSGEDEVLVRRTVQPADGSTGVPVGTDIVVSVSSQIDETLVTESWIVVVHENSATVSGTTTAFGGELTWTPDASLDSATTYTVTVSGSVTGTNGATLGESHTWSFTTEVP